MSVITKAQVNDVIESSDSVVNELEFSRDGISYDAVTRTKDGITAVKIGSPYPLHDGFFFIESSNIEDFIVEICMLASKYDAFVDVD